MPASTLTFLALLASACAVTVRAAAAELLVNGRESRDLDVVTAAMCHYEGRYFAEGALVPARAACLRCHCGRGAVSCRRRACIAHPHPPPGCHLTHRRDACCPQLTCPDDDGAVDRETLIRHEEVYPEMIKPHGHVYPVCVEEGTAYAAGSAMGSDTACEQCFCLGGTRRCVRPKCLSPPLGCKARPAPGVCCPQRYYCDHSSTKPPDERHLHDCKVDGVWIAEGERVSPPDSSSCAHCFCLRGTVRCQSLACAPPLLGCKPLLEVGQCCPHQYQCVFQQRRGLPGLHAQPILDNALISLRNKDRSFRNAPTTTNNTTTILISTATDKTMTSVTNEKIVSTATTKVKRKTSDPPPQTTRATAQTTTKIDVTTDKTTSLATDVSTPEDGATEEPEESVKIIINGTINCTAELSSTTITVNSTKANETEKYSHIADIQPRIPNIAPTFESHTYNPNDIITDRNYNEDFDENESYIINVTSSLMSSMRTNTTLTTPAGSSTTVIDTMAMDANGYYNNSKKTKDEYDYYYNKPTLPPSLPNLKIIPFVAADAVVDDEMSSKKNHAHPILEREDNYPIYYPSIEGKDIPFATRREDLYAPTQFPIFVSKKVESPLYSLPAHKVDLTNEYSSNGDIITSLREYSATTALGHDLPQDYKATTNLPNQKPKFELETPTVNLFSPPVETEGGFIPKDPGIIDDFYAIYTSTPPGSVVPHLTTSMQLDTTKECVSENGHRVLEGEAITLACSVCTCVWGNLHCSQQPCPLPSGCNRRPATISSEDLCCGDLICNIGNTTTPSPLSSTMRNLPLTLNNSQELPASSTELFTELHMLNDTTTPFYTTTQPKTVTKFPTITNKERLDSEVTKLNLESSSTEENVPNNKATTAAEDSETDINNSQEYDDDSDDEGFSLGSVLKLLLSDRYETTTAVSVRHSTVPGSQLPNLVTNTTQSPMIRRQPPKSSSTVISVTKRPPYIPIKQQQPQNTINRIDHLILGESTAIKKSTPRPVTAPFKPIPTRKPAPTKTSTTEKPLTTSKPVEVIRKSEYGQYTSVSQDNVRPSTLNSLGGLGPGLLKLAGCNIYGKMYHVERIIAELSTPCHECRCTELGVQCRQLNCSKNTG